MLAITIFILCFLQLKTLQKAIFWVKLDRINDSMQNDTYTYHGQYMVFIQDVFLLKGGVLPCIPLPSPGEKPYCISSIRTWFHMSFSTTLLMTHNLIYQTEPSVVPSA